MDEQDIPRSPNGSQVFLKSGGPRMTVVGYDPHDVYEGTKTYKCQWFTDQNRLAEGYFIVEALSPAAG